MAGARQPGAGPRQGGVRPRRPSLRPGGVGHRGAQCGRQRAARPHRPGSTTARTMQSPLRSAGWQGRGDGAAAPGCAPASGRRRASARPLRPPARGGAEGRLATIRGTPFACDAQPFGARRPLHVLRGGGGALAGQWGNPRGVAAGGTTPRGSAVDYEVEAALVVWAYAWDCGAG